MNFSVSEFLKNSGYGIQRMAIPFAAVPQLVGIWKDIAELVITVEGMMKDGVIDANERRTLAAKGVRMGFDKIGIAITDDQAGAIIDLTVAILNKIGVLKKGEKK
jgi:hypothetical protein